MPAKTPDRPRIFLHNVHLKGFKSIEDLSIDFQKGLNILIGKNGSGKSNFLEFLFRAIEINQNDRIFFNYAKFDFGSNDEHSFVLELEKELRSKSEKDNLGNRIGSSERFSIDGKVVVDGSDSEYFKKAIEFKNREIQYRGSFRILITDLGYEAINPLYIKFNIPNDLEYVSVSGTVKANLEQEFTNWQYSSNTLSFIHQIFFWQLELWYQDSDELKNIAESEIYSQLKAGLPPKIIENLKLYTTIEDVRFSNNINLYNGSKSIIIENIKLDFKINGNWLPWSQLSDGTKRLFYIIAEVTNTNGMVLIEEPELGIHPHQFNLLMDFLKEQSEHKQITISTHSPKALDHLSQDELNSILITYYDLKKGTKIRHLTGKEITKAKKYMKEVGFFSDYWLLSDLEE